MIEPMEYCGNGFPDTLWDIYYQYVNQVLPVCQPRNIRVSELIEELKSAIRMLKYGCPI